MFTKSFSAGLFSSLPLFSHSVLRSLCATSKPDPYTLNGPPFKSLSLQYGDYDVMWDPVKGLSEVQVDDVYRFSVSTDTVTITVFLIPFRALEELVRGIVRCCYSALPHLRSINHVGQRSKMPVSSNLAVLFHVQRRMDLNIITPQWSWVITQLKSIKESFCHSTLVTIHSAKKKGANARYKWGNLFKRHLKNIYEDFFWRVSQYNCAAMCIDYTREEILAKTLCWWYLFRRG